MAETSRARGGGWQQQRERRLTELLVSSYDARGRSCVVAVLPGSLYRPSATGVATKAVGPSRDAAPFPAALATPQRAAPEGLTVAQWYVSSVFVWGRPFLPLCGHFDHGWRILFGAE